MENKKILLVEDDPCCSELIIHAVRYNISKGLLYADKSNGL